MTLASKRVFIITICVLSVISLNVLYLVMMTNNKDSTTTAINCTHEHSLNETFIEVIEPSTTTTPTTPTTTTTSPSEQSIQQPEVQLKKRYLIGVMSVCEAKNTRQSVRLWLRELAPAHHVALYDYKFFIEQERFVNDQAQNAINCESELKQEQEQYGDLVFLDLKKDEQGWYKLSYKYEKMIQWYDDTALNQYRYFIKVDDDSLLLIDALDDVIKVQEMDFVKNAGAWGYTPYTGTSESDANKYLTKFFPLYAGYRYTGNRVMLDGNWQNRPFHQDTGLSQYTKYMSGGMYVVSNSLVHALAYSSRIVPLSKWTMEDANVGYWISSFRAVWLHIPKILTQMTSACEGQMVVYHPLKHFDAMKSVYEATLKQDWNTACAEALKVTHDRGSPNAART